MISSSALKKDFRYIMKQKGVLQLKGRLLGLQLLAQLDDNLYFEMAGHANRMVLLIKESCEMQL